MHPSLRASALLLPLALICTAAWAKSSDRQQDMVINAGRQSGSYEGNSKILLSNGVIVTQGTLDIRSSAGEIYMNNGEISHAVFTGKQVKLKQQLDDGSWMDATADRVEYNMSSESITFIGNYTVKSPRGSNSGQKMVYNTKTGNMESGGDGSRVITVIKPKSAQGTP